MTGYDTWLGGYESRPAEAWCENAECVNHEEPINVTFEREFGQGWITPEECPQCGGALRLEKPKGEEDDGDGEEGRTQ